MVVNKSNPKRGEETDWLRIMYYLNINKEMERFHIHLIIICSSELQEQRLKYNMKILHLLSLHLLLRHNGARSPLYKMSVKH